MRLILCVLILMLSTVSSTSYSENKPLDLRAVTLKEGKPAPFAGKLLTADALAKIITDFEREIKLLKADLKRVTQERTVLVRREKLLCEIAVDGEKQKQSICLSGCDQKVKLLSDAVNRCENDKRGFFQSPYVNFVIGNVVAGGLCAAASSR